MVAGLVTVAAGLDLDFLAGLVGSASGFGNLILIGATVEETMADLTLGMLYLPRIGEAGFLYLDGGVHSFSGVEALGTVALGVGLRL
jgi:hypothetical protein